MKVRGSKIEFAEFDVTEHQVLELVRNGEIDPRIGVYALKIGFCKNVTGDRGARIKDGVWCGDSQIGCNNSNEDIRIATEHEMLVLKKFDELIAAFENK